MPAEYNPRMPMPSPKRRLNMRFIVRGFFVGLAPLILCAVMAAALPEATLRSLLFSVFPLPPPDATPLPPEIVVPQDALPSGPAGLQEWRVNRGESRRLAGSGFFLRLPDGAVIGVTTAHSLSDLGLPSSRLEGIDFLLSGASNSLMTFDSLYGEPGEPRTGANLSADFVFLVVEDTAALDPALILAPDPRPLPQPGERVLLYSGLGNGAGGVDARSGTVQSAAPEAVWVLMDEQFEAGLMSGSPLISRHTGRVVGMAVAVSPRRGRILIGFHPIGSLLEHAAEANGEIPIAEFLRE